MSIAELRKTLEDIRCQAQEGNLDGVVHTVDQALEALDGTQLVTTTEAAQLLGIRSVNTLKLLVRQSGVRYEMHGNRMMIPLAELERIQDSAEVRNIRATDRVHDSISDLGPKDGLTHGQLDDLAAARPGHLPWKSVEVS